MLDKTICVTEPKLEFPEHQKQPLVTPGHVQSADSTPHTRYSEHEILTQWNHATSLQIDGIMV